METKISLPHSQVPAKQRLLYTFYLLTFSMMQSPAWKANPFSANQEIPRILWKLNTHYCIRKCLQNRGSCEHFTYLISPWCRVLLEKLIHFQLIKKFPEFMENECSLAHSQVPTKQRLLWTFYLLTFSMMQSPSWEANPFSASQETPRVLWKPNIHYRFRKRLACKTEALVNIS